jgi:hypothetical protein
MRWPGAMRALQKRDARMLPRHVSNSIADDEYTWLTYDWAKIMLYSASSFDTMGCSGQVAQEI